MKAIMEKVGKIERPRDTSKRRQPIEEKIHVDLGDDHESHLPVTLNVHPTSPTSIQPPP
jgi:hypothetical protein